MFTLKVITFPIILDNKRFRATKFSKKYVLSHEFQMRKNDGIFCENSCITWSTKDFSSK